MIGKIAKSPYFYVILVVVVFIVLITVRTDATYEKLCQTEAERLSLEWRYDGFCTVNTPDLGWWSLDEYTKILAIRQSRSK